MYTLIMCIGFAHGVCEQVVRIEYPTQQGCRVDLDKETPNHPELIFAVCKAPKEL